MTSIMQLLLERARTADDMADALAYLMRVAQANGFQEISQDLAAIRDKLSLLSLKFTKPPKFKILEPPHS